MNSIAEVRHHIGVVRDTGKITKAMYLISSAKMKKAMRMHDGRRVWVPSINDGWIGFRKLRSSDGEVYFAPNRE